VVDLMGDPRHHRAFLPACITAAVLAFLYAPLMVVVLFSFNRTASLTLPFSGFSTRWYAKLLSQEEVRTAFLRSVAIGLITAALTLVLGTAAAYGLSRSTARWRRVVATLLFLPLALPGLFLGLALMSWFTQTAIKLSTVTIVIGHFVYSLPFFLILARVALDRADPMLEEVGADLGATRAVIFRRITLPQAWPVLVGGAALVFMLSFDEFLVTYFIAGSDQTLPLYIFAQLRRTIDPTINVISTLLLGFTLSVWLAAAALVLLASRRQRRSQRGLA
jgi:spermidine/putrescine transport system permease protein